MTAPARLTVVYGRGEYFRPGQRLVVGNDGSYRIEGASAVAA